MKQRQNYAYNRILEIMVYGYFKFMPGSIVGDEFKIADAAKLKQRGLIKQNIQNIQNNFKNNKEDAGKEVGVIYDFGPDAKNIFDRPPAGFDNKIRINLVHGNGESLTPGPNCDYVQLMVMMESIVSSTWHPKVHECIKWLQNNLGPSKIKINCHGDISGEISMGDGKFRENRATGEQVADWLVRNGLRAPLKNEFTVDARALTSKWESKSLYIQCPSCNLNFLHNDKKIHCRACGEVVHDRCVEEVLIIGALKSSTLGRAFSFSDRKADKVEDVACHKCIKTKGRNQARAITGAERSKQESVSQRQSYQGVINIGLWVCYGGVTVKGNPLIDSASDKVMEGSIAHRLATRLRAHRVTGIEVVGRTDPTFQHNINLPPIFDPNDKSHYYKLKQEVVTKNKAGQVVRREYMIIKKRIFS